MLADGATVHSQIKALSHALRAMHSIDSKNETKYTDSDVLDLLQATLEEHNAVFEDWIEKLEATGWNTSTPAIETARGHRIVMDR